MVGRWFPSMKRQNAQERLRQAIDEQQSRLRAERSTRPPGGHPRAHPRSGPAARLVRVSSRCPISSPVVVSPTWAGTRRFNSASNPPATTQRQRQRHPAMGWTAGRSAFFRSAAGWPRLSWSWRTARPASCGWSMTATGRSTPGSRRSGRRRAGGSVRISTGGPRGLPSVMSRSYAPCGPNDRAWTAAIPRVDAFYRRLADVHLKMMAYQLGYPPDAVIGGCTHVQTYRDVLGQLIAWALQARDRGEEATPRSEHSLVAALASALAVDPAVIAPGRRGVHARPRERGLSRRRARCRGRSARSTRPEPARLVGPRADDRATALPDPRAQTTFRAGVSQLRLSP